MQGQVRKDTSVSKKGKRSTVSMYHVQINGNSNKKKHNGLYCEVHKRSLLPGHHRGGSPSKIGAGGGSRKSLRKRKGWREGKVV